MKSARQLTCITQIKRTVHTNYILIRFWCLCFLLIIPSVPIVFAQNSVANAYKQYAAKRLDSAAVQFERLAATDSSRADVRAMLADIYSQQGRHEEASRQAAEAVVLSPRTACYWTLLGNAQWNSGLTDQALQAYLKSLDIAATEPVQPSTATTVLRSVMPHRRIEKRVAERVAAGQATASDYVLLGYALQMQSRLTESLAAYQQAMTLQPDWMEPYLFASEVYRTAKQPQAMINAYEQAIEHDPFVGSKLYKAAMQDYLAALQKETGSFAYFALGYLHEKGLGTPIDQRQARKWYAYAEQMHNHVAAMKLSRLYEQEAGPGSAEALRRIRRNREAGRRCQAIDFRLPNGNYQTATVYVEPYPADKADPYAAERQRLYDVYGATVDLALLLPSVRPLDAPTASAPQADPLPAASPLTASLLAGPLLNAELSAPVALPAEAPANKEQLAQTFGQRATQFAEPFQLDSLGALMDRTLADYLGDAARSPMMALQRLRDDLIANRADRGFLHYAIAFVHEQVGGTTDWSLAEKWYAYAFQLRYAPAYQRLKHRYGQESAAPVKLGRLEKNWQNGTTELPLTLETPEGDVKTVSLYIMDNMGNSAEPVAGEASRLLDLFGVEVPQPTLARFNALYEEARQHGRSYQELCRQHFLDRP